MIRNLFKRIAEFVTGSSKDDESAAIPFAELSRKKAEEQARKERAERRRRPKDKKSPDATTGESKPQRGDARQRGKGKPSKQPPARRQSGDQKPQRDKAPVRNGRPARDQQKDQRPAREAAPQKEAPQKTPAPKQPRTPAWSLSDFQVPEKEGEVRFHDLDLPIKLMQGIAELGFQYATPIQAGALPETLKGKDAIGKAQTGTGKSAAFLITIINHLAKKPMRGGPERGFPRALILAPTRELALQIEKDALALCKFTPYKIVSLFGGTGYEKQKKGVAGSVDIIVATPGRLIDFKNQKLVDLSRVEILVIDEADRMLDMGFIPDIRKIVYATPHKDQRQTLFFSATYTSDVMRLADQWTREPFNVEIEPDTIESASIDQKIFLVTTDEKFPLLYNLITTKKLTKVLVFTNRRDQARRLCEKLTRYKVSADLLSGEVAQNKRIRALEDFRSGKVQILVATDVAARGLHIDEISHVINYNLPQDAEHYVHRIGRTGRAGATGTSVSFACEDDSYYIPAIEELLGHKLECEYPDNELLQEVTVPGRSQRQPKPQRSQKSSSPWHDEQPSEGEGEPRPMDVEPPVGEVPVESEEESTGTEETPEAPPSRDRSTRRQRPPRNSRKSSPKEAPMPVSPWYEDDPFENSFQEAPAVEKAPEDDAPVETDESGPDNNETAKKAPSRGRQPRRQRSPRNTRKTPPKEAPMPLSPWQEEQPVEETSESVPPPVESESTELKGGASQEKPASEGKSDAAPSRERQAKGPRPVRNTRRPNAPKYRKRPSNRYSKSTRSDK
ncbi:hypothetical protein DSLASN_37700 [Desulfoluna limicola]|uniref:RNA helicase n=1 Tax=Desulfoluna limicola TaxID=2810562 RepID=A0ABM7PL52_9BACT|nr:DEAD/DEAH box helicase [Desulfoluna limicola]BCS98138.1 hypothetical protein DSLASN_37700 [Desulfoluna limicola]